MTTITCAELAESTRLCQTETYFGFVEAKEHALDTLPTRNAQLDAVLALAETWHAQGSEFIRQSQNLPEATFSATHAAGLELWDRAHAIRRAIEEATA